ncbi:MAG: hypothetical protein QMB94_14410 [Phycisphaerales bacterium]
MKSRIAACHIHSEWSYDASWSLDDLVSAFISRGCSVMLMTEHDKGWNQDRWRLYEQACADASTQDMLVVPGIEYSDPSNTIHVLVWGVSEFLGEGLETADLLAKVRQFNGVAVLAHPDRRQAWRKFESSWAADLLGVEVWNRKTDGWVASASGIKLWKALGVVPFAGLDFHRKNQFYPLRMELEISHGGDCNEVFEVLRAGQISPRFRGRDLQQALRSGSGVMRPAIEKLRRVLRAIIPH